MLHSVFLGVSPNGLRKSLDRLAKQQEVVSKTALSRGGYINHMMDNNVKQLKALVQSTGVAYIQFNSSE